MLSVTFCMCNADLHFCVNMPNVVLLRVTFCIYTEYHSAKSHCDECHSAKSHCDECHSAECLIF